MYLHVKYYILEEKTLKLTFKWRWNVSNLKVHAVQTYCENNICHIFTNVFSYNLVPDLFLPIKP